MARYSYETYADMKKNSAQQKTNLSKVGYFKLGDGEEALVRLNCSTISDLEIATIHSIKVKDKFRNVSCLRKSVTEPIDNCPLCKDGNQAKTRVYVKLIKYDVDEFGKVKGIVSLVANLPKKYGDTISNLIQEYGDLREQVFKIKRVGSELNTTYTFMYMNPVKYSEANGFVKDFTDFEGFNLVPHSFIERTKEDINEFLITGEFPLPTRKETTETKEVVSSVESVPTHPGVQQQEDDFVAPFREVPVQTTMAQQSTQTTTTQTNVGTTRPRRTYDWSN